MSRLRVPAHWRLLAFCFVVAAVAIVFEGIATHTVGASAEPHEALGGPAPLADSRPILVAKGSKLVSLQPPPGRRIALTFDDGPDPHWTPKIAAILRREHVPATFFVIGSDAARYPDLVRELVRDGNELGNHTYTHVALSNGPDWQRRLQLDLTEATIAGITGHYTRLVRPPYSATPDSVSVQDEHDLAKLAGGRYLIVLANYDSEDWSRPGVAKIVRNASPPGPTAESSCSTTAAQIARDCHRAGGDSTYRRGWFRPPELITSSQSTVEPVARGEHAAAKSAPPFASPSCLRVLLLLAGLVGLLFAARRRPRIAGHQFLPQRRPQRPPTTGRRRCSAYNERRDRTRGPLAWAIPDFEVIVVTTVDRRHGVVEGLSLRVRLRQRTAGSVRSASIASALQSS